MRARSWRGSRWFLVLAAAGVLVGAAVALYLPVSATSTSSYCGSCHPMKDAYSTWHRSAHASVACVKCHVPPGVSAAVGWRAKELRNIWASYLNMKPSSNREPRPSVANCIQCHPLKGLMGIPGVIRMPHALHVDVNDLTCIDCHNKVTHAKPGESSVVSMGICVMCHKQTADPKRCSFCHSTPPKGTSHPTGYIKTHGSLAAADEQACLRCHHDKAAFCDACHAKPPPGHYTDNWRFTHGTQARQDRARCLGCHSYEGLCRQCHEVHHPTDWGTSHASVALKGTRSCLVCHPQDMCTACHQAKGVVTQ